MGAAMTLDEFLDLHDRLVMDSVSAIDDPPVPYERRCAEGEPPNGIERRNGLNKDTRPQHTTEAGLLWLDDNRRWEEAYRDYKRRGRPIDAVMRAWCASGGEFSNMQASLVHRLVDLSSEREVTMLLVKRIVELEKSDPAIPKALSPRLTAKEASKRAGALWMIVSGIVDTQTWTQRHGDCAEPDPWED